MANDNEVYLDENSFKFIFDELFEAFNDLVDEFKKLKLKNNELKKFNIFSAKEKNKTLIEKENLLKEMKVLDEEKENLLKSKKSIMKKNAKLRKESETLKPILKKFTIVSQKLQLVLNN